ncbi:hypothetical protein XspCFBP7912_20610 [Xanthomonas sp. CFBP 7912]|nr:hypothetical protein XspCFBP7912_20610 [Xanthomonas sp. CFBP 7912]RJS01669.1 hypothetical protein XnspCFBP7698_21060 [Xanthomonas sp. CFBP 7698]
MRLRLGDAGVRTGLALHGHRPEARVAVAAVSQPPSWSALPHIADTARRAARAQQARYRRRAGLRVTRHWENANRAYRNHAGRP